MQSSHLISRTSSHPPSMARWSQFPLCQRTRWSRCRWSSASRASLLSPASTSSITTCRNLVIKLTNSKKYWWRRLQQALSRTCAICLPSTMSFLHTYLPLRTQLWPTFIKAVSQMSVMISTLTVSKRSSFVLWASRSSRSDNRKWWLTRVTMASKSSSKTLHSSKHASKLV